MKLTVIGSHLCPITLGVLNDLYKSGISVEFKDILASHADLKYYLSLRESHEAFSEIRGTNRLGIPCFLTADNRITMKLDDALKALPESRPADNALPSSCIS